MPTLQSVLMHRDDMSAEEARNTIADIRQRIREGEDPEEILHDEFGLEPDYVYDLF